MKQIVFHIFLQIYNISNPTHKQTSLTTKGKPIKYKSRSSHEQWKGAINYYMMHVKKTKEHENYLNHFDFD